MKPETQKVKVRRIGRKKKALPPHTWETHPTANQGEVNKTLIIAVVTILALVALAVLLFFSDTFVGQATFDYTGMNDNYFGILVSDWGMDNAFEVDVAQTVPIIANFDDQEASSFEISLSYDPDSFEVSCDEDVVFNHLDTIKGFSDYVVDKGSTCADGTINLHYMMVPPMDGTTYQLTGDVVLAELIFTAKDVFSNDGPTESSVVLNEEGSNSFSESVDVEIDPVDIEMYWNGGVTFEIVPATVECTKIMQYGCYPIGVKYELDDPIGDLYCTSEFGEQGVCTNYDCKANMKNLNGQINDIKKIIEAEGEVPYCGPNYPTCPDLKGCYPGELFLHDDWPEDNTDQGICLTDSYIDIFLSECNGIEFFCEAKTLVGDQLGCGSEEGNCKGQNELCADGLVCGATDDNYADGITFCMQPTCDTKTPCAEGYFCDGGVCTPDVTDFICTEDGQIGCTAGSDTLDCLISEELGFSMCATKVCSEDFLTELFANALPGGQDCDTCPQKCFLSNGEGVCMSDISGFASCTGVNGYCSTKIDNDLGPCEEGEGVCVPALDECGDGLECTDGICQTPDGQCASDADLDGHCTDDDCDDSNDLVWTQTDLYPDQDGDGFGFGPLPIPQCVGDTLPPSYVLNNDDCDDTNANVNAYLTGYPDADGDDYGALTSEQICAAALPDTHVSTGTDCNDTNPLIMACGDGETCTEGACVADDITIEGESCTFETEVEDCGLDLYCVEEVCTNVTGKVILYDDSHDSHATLIRAVEDFIGTDVTVYTVLYGENEKKLVIKSQLIEGGLGVGGEYMAIVDYDGVVFNKSVIVQDRYPHDPEQTVYGTLVTAVGTKQ
jgi:hypothetical protein